MTIVLVHGNPETDALWGPLVDALGRDDVLRLSPTWLTVTGSRISWKVSTDRSTSWATTSGASTRSMQ